MLAFAKISQTVIENKLTYFDFQKLTDYKIEGQNVDIDKT